MVTTGNIDMARGTIDGRCIPDIFSDRFDINENALGVLVVLVRSRPVPTASTAPVGVSGDPVAMLRFSPENWKLLLMTGRRQLKAREQANGQSYKLPQDLLGALGLAEGDW